MEEAVYVPEAVIKAQLKLIAINFESWKPDVEKWLHSEESEASLKELLMHVPCAPTIH